MHLWGFIFNIDFIFEHRIFLHEYCIYLILPSIPILQRLPNLSNLKVQIHDLFFNYCLYIYIRMYVSVFIYIHACIHRYIYHHNLLSPFSMLNTYMYLGPTIGLDSLLGGMSLRRLIPPLWEATNPLLFFI